MKKIARIFIASALIFALLVCLCGICRETDTFSDCLLNTAFFGALIALIVMVFAKCEKAGYLPKENETYNDNW